MANDKRLEELRKNVVAAPVQLIIRDSVDLLVQLLPRDAFTAFGSEENLAKLAIITARRMIAALQRDVEETIRLQQEGDDLIRAVIRNTDEEDPGPPE